MNCFCEFHNDCGHTAKEYNHLRDEIERMVRKGWLQNWVKRETEQEARSGRSPPHQGRAARPDVPAFKLSPPTRGMIHMIIGGQTDGDSNWAQKVQARWANEDGGASTLHNDALVLTMTIANFDVDRAMVDTDSSVNVLFHEEYLKMELEMEIKLVETTLFGFGGGVVEPIGWVKLPVSLGALPA
ncbi:hypothetical protein DH2020_004711 [Rehmannia glutinosa]|uniref:Uncharacterized protein n=1 Tax=Rehmannia glutinosa TaxID=99300 RepID=A0ABR0XQK2_REHGL